MTHRNTWKAFEREAARFFGSTRTPLSGGNSKITRSDSLHKRIYIESKYRAKHAILATWRDAKAKADVEGKVPVVCVREKGKKGFWILIHCEDLEEIASIVGGEPCPKK